MELVPNHELIHARAALRRARHLRAQALVDVTEGTKSVWEIISEACTSEGAPLLKLELRQIVLASPSTRGAPDADRFLRYIAHLLEIDTDLTRKPLSWLVDPRAGGRRLRAWIDATHAREAPWPGFPHLPIGAASGREDGPRAGGWRHESGHGAAPAV